MTTDERLLEKARENADQRHTTGDQLLSGAPLSPTEIERRSKAYEALMKRLEHVNAGRKFTREEMNERR